MEAVRARLLDAVTTTLIDLSHKIEHGMTTYPGLPVPSISDHLSRAVSRERYGGLAEFQIGRIEMIANTGTYLDTPAHRFAEGFDLAGLPLEKIAFLRGVVVKLEERGCTVEHLRGFDVAGRAVLIHTGWSKHWRTEAYGADTHPFVTREAAHWLAEAGAALVGIDSVNIDDIRDLSRPAHTILLRHNIPIVEHLTNLETLAGRDFTFFAVPPRVKGMGTFPVRAFGAVDDPSS